MRSTLVRLMKDESGATMIEYGLIAALVSVAAITALTSLGGSIESIFTVVSDKLSAASDAANQSGGGGS
jgi:pilus assembly protein Flp/PilA